MSMTRKGRKSRKPISKPRRSSETRKAGISARQGASAGWAGGRFARSRNSARSASRTFAAMNLRNGSAAAASPSISDSRPSFIGTMPSTQAASSTGCITKKERNSASPISTGLGGTPCAPMAVRSSASTMTMRVKAVAITRIEGARLSSPISAVSWTRRAVAPGCPVAPRSSETDCAAAGPAASSSSAAARAAIMPAAPPPPSPGTGRPRGR